MTDVHEKATSWAAKNGIEILHDKELIKNPGDTHIWIHCPAGHESEVSWVSLEIHRKCALCKNVSKLSCIEDMRAIAISRGGRCESPEYLGLKVNLNWECNFGHKWVATPNNVKHHGSWCPYCIFNIGEELTRAALKEAFPGEEFPRTRRLPWLQGLELDGYCENLFLAFEFQGKQHYERVEHFQRKEGDFEAQVERDRLTAERCENQGISLLVVPYSVGYTNIRRYVRDQLEALGMPEPAPMVGNDMEFYESLLASGSFAKDQLKKACDIAAQKGGKCLSTQYIGYRMPMKFCCGVGHTFTATLEAIDQPEERGPRFCTDCSPTKKKEDDDIRAMVEGYGFKYFGSESKVIISESGNKKYRRFLSIECPKGHHIPDMDLSNFRPGPDGNPLRGCRVCRKGKIGDLKRDDITDWCIEHGLTRTGYKNKTSYCDWECSKGHSFTDKFNTIRVRANPCPECDLKIFADANKVKLVSEFVAGPTQSHTWECTICGHHFELSRMSFGRRKTYPCTECNGIQPTAAQ